MKKRFRINIFSYFAISSFLLLNIGCSDDFFDEKNSEKISPDQHYKNMIDGNASYQGAIIYLQDIMPRLIILDGLRSDMMDVTPHADAHMKNINEQIFTKDNFITNPADLYKVIINLNEVLANIDKIAESDREFNEFIAHQIKGSLLGMRAWTYFTIVKMFGETVYIEDNLPTLPSGGLNQVILDKTALIDTLINQLTPYVFDDANAIEISINNYVNIKALLGELYLEKNDYTNAITYLKLACESFGNTPLLYKVNQSYENAGWSNIFLNAQSAIVENISVMPYSSRENQNNPLANWMGYNFEYKVKPTTLLVDSFMAQNPFSGPQGDAWRGRGVTFAIDTLAMLADSTFLTNAYITKYAVDVNDPFSSDIVISRAADIHLMLAEALNRTGDPANQNLALILLNSGFNAVNPKPALYVQWATNRGIRGRVSLRPRAVPEELTAAARILYIEDLIMAERALELAFEGKRWNDLVRVASRRDDPAYLADRVAAKFAGTPKYNTVRDRLLTPGNWYLKLK